MFNEKYIYIGIDIGSVSIKMVIISHDNNKQILQQIQKSHPAFFEATFFSHQWNQIPLTTIITKYRRIMGEPLRSTLDLLQPVINTIPEDKHVSLAVTGAGGKLVAQQIKGAIPE